MIDIFNFVFNKSKLEETAHELDEFFKKNNYPNLYVSLVDSYDGFWKVKNKRTGEDIFSCYNNGAVVAYYDNRTCMTKLAFYNKIIKDNKYVLSESSRTYVEFVQSVTEKTPVESESVTDKYKIQLEPVIEAVKHVSSRTLFSIKKTSWNKYHKIEETDPENIKAIKAWILEYDSQIEGLLNEESKLKRKVIEYEVERAQDKRNQVQKTEAVSKEERDEFYEKRATYAIKMHEQKYHQDYLAALEEYEKNPPYSKTGCPGPTYRRVSSNSDIGKLNHVYCISCMMEHPKDPDRWDMRLDYIRPKD